LLAFLKIDGDAFEEVANKLDDDGAILNWVREERSETFPDAIEQWKPGDDSRQSRHRCKRRAFHFLKESVRRRTQNIRTYFDLIEFDEGRLK